MNGYTTKRKKQQHTHTQRRVRTRLCSFTHQSHAALFLAVPLSGSDLHHSMNKAAERRKSEEGEGRLGGGGEGCGGKGETVVNPEK